MLYYRLLTFGMLLLLASCVATPPGSEITEQPDTATVWDDLDRSYVPAIRLLIGNADDMIAAGRLADAETVLNRALRIDNRAGTVWSRLAWLSLQQGDASGSRDYVRRSNSLVSDKMLLRFNWELYRSASERMTDDAGIETALRQLESLN